MITYSKKYRIQIAISIFFIILFVFSIPCYASTSLDVTDIAGNASATDAQYLPSDAPKINAVSAIVMDIDTGDILYEKSPHQQLYPASITKVLTCLLAIEQGDENDILTVSSEVMSQVEAGSSSIGLEAGEQLSLKDALYGMMLNSGNECALSIAEYLGGSTQGFSDMMNEKAKSLGCKDSHFVNPNGLQDENHYTSAYDMALIGRAAYQYPEFKILISSQSYTIPATNQNEERPLWQENRLLYEGNGEYYYEYSTGGKTGYTEAALATLISFAERDGRRLCCVVMRCEPTTESYLDSIKLYNFCFNKYKLCKPLVDYDVNAVNNENYTILSDYYNDLTHSLPKYYVNQSYSFYIRSFISDEEIEKKVIFFDKPVDNKAGMIQFLYEGQKYGEVEITVDMPFVNASSTDALRNKKREPAKESKILKWAKRIIVISLVLIILLLTLLLILRIRKVIQIKETKRNIKYFPISKDKRKE